MSAFLATRILRWVLDLWGKFLHPCHRLFLVLYKYLRALLFLSIFLESGECVGYFKKSALLVCIDSLNMRFNLENGILDKAFIEFDSNVISW